MLWTFTLRGDAAVFNVLNFGATPNDASDDRAAIQAALDAAGNGDLVLVPSGLFRLASSVKPKSNTFFGGSGQLTGDVDTYIDISGRTHVEIYGLGFPVGNSITNQVIGGSGASELLIHDISISNMTKSSGFGPFGIHFSSGVTDSTIRHITATNIGPASQWGRCACGGRFEQQPYP